jgi:hypothetical protein
MGRECSTHHRDEKCIPTAIQSVNPRGRDRVGIVGVDVRIILKRILKKWRVRLWTGFMGLRIGSIDGLL